MMNLRELHEVFVFVKNLFVPVMLFAAVLLIYTDNVEHAVLAVCAAIALVAAAT